MINNIDSDMGKQEFDKGTEFIDVREHYEFSEFRIPGSRLIPMSEMNARWQEIPKDKDVVIYCRTGSRSSSLVFQLHSSEGRAWQTPFHQSSDSHCWPFPRSR